MSDSAALGLRRDAVALARRFHELYEELAPAAGYETRPETRVPWASLPRDNRFLMIAVCTVILREMDEEAKAND